TPASSASLLLNLESVLTALLAWIVFRENVDVRIFLSMVAIVAGGAPLSGAQGAGAGTPWWVRCPRAPADRQHLDARRLRRASGPDRGDQGRRRGDDQHRDCTRARPPPARPGPPAVRGRDRAGRVWHQPRCVRPCPASPRGGKDRRLLLDGALRGRRA